MHTHRMHSRRWRLFNDGREDWRRPTPNTNPSTRAVCVVPRCRVLPDNVNHLSAILERGFRHPTAFAFRALFRLRALTHCFDSVIVSCSCLESDCGDGWDDAAKRSTASVFP